MAQPTRCPAELADLLTALTENTITDEQFARLNNLLEHDPAARRYYAVHVDVHAGLSRRWGETAPAARPSEATPPPDTGRTRRSWAVPVALLVLAASVLAAVVFTRPGPPAPRPDEFAATGDAVATLSRTAEADWEDTRLPTRPGSALPPGRMNLLRGLAQIEFRSGATVVLEGPAELWLDGPAKAFCSRGKLRAVVPPQGAGFTVGTPQVDLIDRGSEFAASVSDSGAVEAHVFQGQVEACPRGRQSGRVLAAGHGERWGPSGATSTVPLAPAEFASARDLDFRTPAAFGPRHEAWLAAVKAQAADPSLLVYFPFEGETSRNKALRDVRPDGDRDGGIIGAQWADGRWPGKRALEFKSDGDQVRFYVATPCESVTLSAWVRPDKLERHTHSLLASAGSGEGAIQWQVRATGEVVFSVLGQGAKWTDYTTPRVVDWKRLGRWVHLAVVYDATARAVTHYLDGQAVAVRPVAVKVPIRIGHAELGNGTPQGKDAPSRTFQGRMDEFAAFARALTLSDVYKLFQGGQPEP